MKRFLVAIALISAGLFSLVVIAFASPLNAAMRADRRAREESEDDFDPDDPGYDVDDCAHMRGTTEGSCARCEGT